MAKGHKKIVGTYCYGCKNRFCEFCCNGDKYEEVEHEEVEHEEVEDEKVKNNGIRKEF